MAFNQKLANSISFEEIEKLGFKLEPDKDEDARGNYYIYENDKFSIMIDAWYEVTLSRKNPDTDHISIVIDSRHDLECLINFIQD